MRQQIDAIPALVRASQEVTMRAIERFINQQRVPQTASKVARIPAAPSGTSPQPEQSRSKALWPFRIAGLTALSDVAAVPDNVTLPGTPTLRFKLNAPTYVIGGAAVFVLSVDSGVSFRLPDGSITKVVSEKITTVDPGPSGWKEIERTVDLVKTGAPGLLTTI